MKPSHIHSIADELRIPWDGDAVFMKWCKDLTGESHLDKMSSEQLFLIAKALKNGDKPGKRVMGFWRFKDADSKFRLEDFPYVTRGSF